MFRFVLHIEISNHGRALWYSNGRAFRGVSNLGSYKVTILPGQDGSRRQEFCAMLPISQDADYQTQRLAPTSLDSYGDLGRCRNGLRERVSSGRNEVHDSSRG